MSIIIAEIGSNWKRETPQDSYKCTLEHIRAAAKAGANISKLQLFRADDLFNRTRAPIQYAKMKDYEFPLDWLPDVQACAFENDMDLWASVFDLATAKESIDYLDGIKIASGDLTNHDLIKRTYKMAQKAGISFVVSTGAAYSEEIVTAMQHLNNSGGVILRYVFQCVSAYPAAASDYNLSVYRALDRWGIVGLSDHTPNINSMLIGMAVGLGYQAFEKHFTLDTSLDLPDKRVSLDPTQFSMYVDAIKQAKTIYGDGEKKPTDSEIQERVWARRGKDGLRPNNDNS